MTPLETTKHAFENNELHLLLLGEEPYDHATTKMPWGYRSDMNVMFNEGIILYLHQHPEKTPEFEDALIEICEYKLGMHVTATIITLEHKNKQLEHPTSNIDTQKIADHLKTVIEEKKDYLAKEQLLYDAYGYELGMYGSLKELAKLSEELGGPIF